MVSFWKLIFNLFVPIRARSGNGNSMVQSFKPIFFQMAAQGFAAQITHKPEPVLWLFAHIILGKFRPLKSCFSRDAIKKIFCDRLRSDQIKFAQGFTNLSHIRRVGLIQMAAIGRVKQPGNGFSNISVHIFLKAKEISPDSTRVTSQV